MKEYNLLGLIVLAMLCLSCICGVLVAGLQIEIERKNGKDED